MKWPFARHNPAVAEAPVAPRQHAVDVDPIVAPSRREWTTLPPLEVAGGRAITLTSATREFTQGLASRQNLLHTARLEHVRRMDSPSGSFRGVLSPATTHDAHIPELQEPSALPPVERRSAGVVRGGESPLDQLLAIGDDAPFIEQEPAPQPQSPSDPIGDGSNRPRFNLADSRRQGLGPAYHGPLPEAMRAERERAGITSEPIPPDLRTTMRDVLGVDVGDRLIHRGPAVSAQAQSLSAEAFTREGEVYIADSVGPLDQARGRATAAHELTHAAQQLVHGALDSESSAQGRAMEAHAQRVEQFVRGDAAATKPSPEMLHAKHAVNDKGDAAIVESTQQMMREMIDTGFARPDGKGGIIFTMPASSMTATDGTQRLTTAAPPAQGSAANPDHWNPLASFGNTVAQGIGSDMLGLAGSVFGFSDSFMGEQRSSMADADRAFRRDQTKQAFTELRMEHLRTAELQRVNAEQVTLGRPQLSSLDEERLHDIEQRVQAEVDRRMQLLNEQTNAALEQLNTRRTTAHQEALEHVPDESYDAAFHQLFDNPDNDELPTEDEIRGMLMRSPGGTGRPRAGGAPGSTTPPTAPAGGAHPSPTSSTGPTATPSTATPTPAAHAAPTGEHHAAPEHPGPTGAGAHTPTGAHGTTGTGAGAHHQDDWRTAGTMGERLTGMGNALIGDIAHGEIGLFGSMLGFDSAFERGLHQDIDHGQAATAHGGAAAHTTPGGAGGAHAAGTHAADPAHAATAAHAPGAAGHGAPGHGAQTRAGEAHDQVENLVSDPYALDELASRLYPNIRTRLRQELLIDRERAGLLADFR